MKNKKLSEVEQEKEMYIICFSVLAICLVLLLFLSSGVPISIFDGPITGAVVADIEKEGIIDYNNVSFENVTKELASRAILQAENDMQEMQEAGFGVAWVNDTLIEARRYFEGEDYTALLEQTEKIKNARERREARGLLIKAQQEIGMQIDYSEVLERTKAISERKAEAYEIMDLIRASELRVNEFEKTGLNATPILSTLSNAKTEFREERYKGAVELLAGIELTIDDIESENTLVKSIYRAGKETTINFIKEHYIAIIITLVIIVVLFLLFYNRVMVGVLKRKVKDMSAENDVLTELMKKAQKEYYKKGVIPKETYDIKLSKYKERAGEIKRQLPVVQARLDKLAKMKSIV